MCVMMIDFTQDTEVNRLLWQMAFQVEITRVKPQLKYPYCEHFRVVIPKIQISVV